MADVDTPPDSPKRPRGVTTEFVLRVATAACGGWVLVLVTAPLMSPAIRRAFPSGMPDERTLMWAFVITVFVLSGITCVFRWRQL
jgi:hypothetical protein